MVGGAGNAPVVTSGVIFFDTGFTDQQPDRLPKIGSGSGSRTHLNEFMRLISVLWSSFPHEMVESVGNAPTSACLQGKCIPCLPRPLLSVEFGVQSAELELWQVALVL